MFSCHSNHFIKSNQQVLNVPNAGSPATLAIAQDTEAEAEERRRNRINQRRSLVPDGNNSFRSGGVSSGDQLRQGQNRHGPVVERRTAAELQNIYSNCIKLSQNNKITVKNAFQLKLIDHMLTLLKASDEPNFKLATATLDAGTKIYINRVDCVYSDAQKVANNLLQAMANKKSGKINENDDDQDMDGDDEDQLNGENGDDGNHPDVDNPEGRKKKKPIVKKKRSGKTLASAESLKADKIEMNVEIDPIFHKITTSHDMGNINGLLLANLATGTNGQLILDSSTVVSFRDKPKNPELSQEREKTSLEPFKGLLKDLMEKDHKILTDPFFETFNFSNRDSATDYSMYRDMDGETTTRPFRSLSTFAFDLDAPVEQIVPETESSFHMMQGDNNCGDGMTGFDDPNSDDDELMDRDPEDADVCNQIPGDLMSGNQVIQAVNLNSAEALKKILSLESDDYSYFANILKKGWQGPNYWKSHPWFKAQMKILKNQAVSSSSADVPKEKRERKKKEWEPNQFTKTSEGMFETGVYNYANLSSKRQKSFEEDRKLKLNLRSKTLEKWMLQSDKSLEPEYTKDIELVPFHKDNHIFASLKPKVTSSQAKATVGRIEGNQDDDENDDDDDNCPVDDPIDGRTSPILMDEGFPPSQPVGSSQTDPSQTDQLNTDGLPGFTESNLVKAPDAIHEIKLPFAKYAKRMDVRKLKRVMINLINHPQHDMVS